LEQPRLNNTDMTMIQYCLPSPHTKRGKRRKRKKRTKSTPHWNTTFLEIPCAHT